MSGSSASARRSAATDPSWYLDSCYSLNHVSPDTEILAVVECKRVDPNLGRWAFVRTPFGYGAESFDYGVYDVLEVPESAVTARISAALLKHPHVPAPFGLAFELRTEQKGDGIGGRNDAVSQAITQVLKAAVGLFLKCRETLRAGRRVIVVPLILTTAELWVSQVQLTRSDLSTGKVEGTDAVQWPRVQLTTRATRNLTVPSLLEARISRQPSAEIGSMAKTFAAAQISGHARTLWIASHDGIQKALIDIAAMIASEL